MVPYSTGPVLDSTSYNAKEEKGGQQQLHSEQPVVQETDSIDEGEEVKREGEDEGERSGLSDEEGKTGGGGGGGREREDVSSLSSESPDTSLTK